MDAQKNDESALRGGEMQTFMIKMTQGYTVWRVKLPHKIRAFIGTCCHFIFKGVIVQFRGTKEHTTIISNATYSPWRVDEVFCGIMSTIESHSLLDKMRLYELWQLAAQVKHLKGQVIEVGCWRGGAGCMLAHRIAEDTKDTLVFLCDTFRGVVKTGCHDTFYKGQEFADSSLTIVSNLAKRMGLNNISLLSGIFPEETGADIEHHLFKFAHIDVDVYQSARDAFEWLLPRLVSGAIVVFDDYGFASTPGIRRYIDELQGHSELIIVRNINGQAVIIKR